VKGLTILGSTGTIGVNTLDVVARHQERFRVVALTANRDDGRMAEQCARWQPRFAVMADEGAATRLDARLRRESPATEVLAGSEGLARVASHDDVDYVMAGIVGAAGLMPSLAAARSGKRVLLANKEALVMSGDLFMRAVRDHGAELLPIDSEHNAVFQCMPGDHAGDLDAAGVSRILLTGSGGPFRTTPRSELGDVTPAQACAHPNWVMGRKISVDSATMMNKGLEVIEACWLFATSVDRIEVVIHPQSVVHSMVEYEDGSVLAQLGHPDMRTPIAHALCWPRRMASGVDQLDLARIGRLDFEPADFDRFPCLGLGFEAARAGGGAGTLLNAANEIAVDAFLTERIAFTDIPTVIEQTLAHCSARAPESLEDVLALDASGRKVAAARVAELAQ
jgi:1-deoxy-D-xylulose-5-phosphate reductoisomerase